MSTIGSSAGTLPVQHTVVNLIGIDAFLQLGTQFFARHFKRDFQQLAAVVETVEVVVCGKNVVVCKGGGIVAAISKINGKYSLSDEFYPDNVTRRAAPKFYYSPQNFILSLPRTGTVPEANREKLEKYLQRMNLVSFSKYTQKKSFPSSVRTPFELQNDFIEFLQVLYAPYCYSREKESIARTLRDYLDAHYTEEISLNDLARQYSYSPSHLIRSFHQAYGASPMQYLKKLRIEHASQLLLHSDATIQSVGEMVGLRIPSYFIRVFKQEIGITPAQYRMFYAEGNGGSETPYGRFTAGVFYYLFVFVRTVMGVAVLFLYPNQ